MERFEIKMPKLGESITEGTIIQWNVKPGDRVKEDDVLFEVSTAKVSAEIPSPVEGTIVEILFQEGAVVPVGVVVAIVDLAGENIVTEIHTDNEARERESEKNEEDEVIPVTDTPVLNENREERWYSPVVLRLAAEAGLPQEELASIPGTGYEGRLSKKDIERYIGQKNKKEMPVAGVSHKTVEVSSEQVQQKKTEQKISSPVVETVSGHEDGVEIREMDYVRRLIADHMVLSKKTSPHVTTIVEADVTNLVRWRERVKDDFFRREGVRLTFMAPIVEATAKALVDFPMVNASVNGYQILLKKHVNVGVAVAMDNGNLIVPVIKNANQLNVKGLALAVDSLATKARSNRLSPDDIQGGTFTITNFGTFKNIIGTPIINQPEVAILGVGHIEKKPAVLETPDGDVIAIRHKMYLSLSYDHRIIDGSLGGAFVRRIADYLENWKE